MKIILTGATGYVGEGTLLELLKVDEVKKVLSVSRVRFAYICQYRQLYHWEWRSDISGS